MKHAEALVATAQRYAAIVQRLLQTSSSTGRSNAGAAGVHIARAAEIHQTGSDFLEQRSCQCQCHGCGREAVGLRKCSRCKQAHYCRWGRRPLPWCAALQQWAACAEPFLPQRAHLRVSVVINCSRILEPACLPAALPRLQSRVPEGALANTQARVQASLSPEAPASPAHQPAASMLAQQQPLNPCISSAADYTDFHCRFAQCHTPSLVSIRPACLLAQFCLHSPTQVGHCSM